MGRAGRSPGKHEVCGALDSGRSHVRALINDLFIGVDLSAGDQCDTVMVSANDRPGLRSPANRAKIKVVILTPHTMGAPA